jgi:hypothetical protein
MSNILRRLSEKAVSKDARPEDRILLGLHDRPASFETALRASSGCWGRGSAKVSLRER